jgi:HD-GYP domain-containing protein (c-di-GMP phosphodiesterase class II)
MTTERPSLDTAAAVTYVPIERTLLLALSRLPTDVYALDGANHVLVAEAASATATLASGPSGRLFVRGDALAAVRHALPEAIEALIATQLHSAEARLGATYETIATAIAPLFVSGGVLGSEDLTAIESMADVLSDLMHEDIRWFHDLAHAMDHGPGWHLHALNSSIYAIAIAVRRDLPGDEVRRIGRGAFLLDIGKTQLPAELLERQGALSEEEWGLMRNHPWLGADLVRRLRPGQPPDYLDLIRDHHERLDGSGYMLGLRGTELPLAIQIAAVVDVFDAMTARRPHRGPETVFHTLRQMRVDMAGMLSDEVILELIQTLGRRR